MDNFGTENTIIAVAGGKGGVGKSIFSANLAIALAMSGHSTVAVDLDLGGSNLHLYLGVPNDYPGIGDYLMARSDPLKELMIPTSIENLKFIPGDGRTPGMANINFGHKIRLIRDLKRIPAKYVVLDIGSGSNATAIDFFGIMEKGIIIMTPDMPAIMNTLTFLKNYIFRSMQRVFHKHIDVLELLKKVQKTPMAKGPASMVEIQNSIRNINPQFGEMLSDLFKNFCPRIVFNQGDYPEQLNLIRHIDQSLAMMNIKAEYFGFIFYDPKVRKSIYERKPLIPFYADCIFSRGIVDIADRLDRRWHQKILNSNKLLIEYTEKYYKEVVSKTIE